MHLLMTVFSAENLTCQLNRTVRIGQVAIADAVQHDPGLARLSRLAHRILLFCTGPVLMELHNW